MIKLIGISGVATAGKDTFFRYLKKLFRTKNVDVKRIALADKLKEEINPYLKETYNISAFTENPEEKKKIRSFLVAHGKTKRNQSLGTYWTSLIQDDVYQCCHHGIVPVITDIRYDEYPEDEVFWCQSKNKGILIHLERIGPDGKIIQPANSDEQTNDLKLRNKANLLIQYPTFIKCNNLEELDMEVYNFLSKTGISEKILKFNYE